jgi:hypothetical protein
LTKRSLSLTTEDKLISALAISSGEILESAAGDQQRAWHMIETREAYRPWTEWAEPSNTAAAPGCELVADLFDLKIRTFVEKQSHWFRGPSVAPH